jgi:hypothetical protein
MTKKKKAKPQNPDETFSHGPMRMARLGKNLIVQSNWSPDEFAKMQLKLVEEYPAIIQEIDQLVGSIAQLVSELPADQLLHRAWWEMVGKHIKIKSESDVSAGEIISVRMLDYVQSIIASVAPAAHRRAEISEEEWQTLKTKIEQLFQTVTTTYQICLSAKNKADDPNLNEHFEEFKFKAQLYWCSIRGRRHQVHEIAYLKDMFLPHSGVLKELFGITGEQFVESVTQIWQNLTFGLPDLVESFNRFKTDVESALAIKLAGQPIPLPDELPNLMQQVLKENGWEQRRNEVYGRVAGTDFFDLEKITNLPKQLLDELTWSPGEELEFFAPGDFRGWPLRVWPVFKRPFIRLNDRYCCFDLYSLFDHLYRVMQRIILRLKPDYHELWKLKQQEQSEALPLNYIQRILPGATVWRSVYYQWYAGSGKKEWCEADGLVVYDDHLFIVECRGGAFTYTSPATDFPAFVSSLKNLVLKPAAQGKRFLDYLNSADSVPVFDHQQQQIGVLQRGDFRRVIICPVTLDPFTELAAQVQHLRKIGVDVGAHPVWAVSLDDLRVYADVFENPLIFLHFVEQRMRAFQSDVIQAEDELDHLGLYLEHNHYSLHAQQLRGTSDARITFNGFTSEIDKFFSARLLDPAVPCPLKQKTPRRILEIVEFLTRKNLPGRSRLASFLLDFSGDWREKLSGAIDDELARQPATRRPKPMSSHGGVCVTLYCWTPSSLPRDTALALAHTRTVLLVNDDAERLMLEIEFDAQGALQDASWQWITKASIPAELLPALESAAAQLRQQRVAKAKAAQGKIGRNDPCPCGRDKKFKRCCGR